MRKSKCINCGYSIFRPIGWNIWFHESPRWRKCCVQQYEGWYPQAEPLLTNEERMQIAAEMSKL